MTFLNRVSRAMTAGLLDAGRTQARRYLLEQNDRFLLDNGFSRELLAQGNGAWPWRVDEPGTGAVPTFSVPPTRVPAPRSVEKSSRREEDRAVAELEAMSDADLSDLGIARAGIADAVRNGRPDEYERIHGEHDRKAA